MELLYRVCIDLNSVKIFASYKKAKEYAEFLANNTDAKISVIQEIKKEMWTNRVF